MAQLRIIAGIYKGRYIASPKDIRPTRQDVREAIFNVLAEKMAAARILDLFAGSGAFGIEALSRGADDVVFVDNDRRSTQAIEKNITAIACDNPARTKVFTLDAERAIKLLHKKNERFDIIFLDPPYYRNLIKKCLKTLCLYDILTPLGLVIAEHFKKDHIAEPPMQLSLMRQLGYGDTVISIYNKK